LVDGMAAARWSVLAQDLRERIALGDVGESGELESEAGLGARYGVSRVTVRRALELLRDEGLISSRRGSGWFVVGASFRQQLALGTFRHAASAVAEAGGRTTRRVVEFGYRQPPASTAVLIGVGPDADALFSRSVRFVDDTPLDVVTEWVPAESAGSISRDDAEGDGIWQTLQRAGRAVETVRQTITAGVANTADAAVLNVGKGSPLLLVRRLALAADDRPLALSDHRYLAHRFALEVEFHGWTSAAAAEPPGLRVVAPS
jgi:GntR family transcriptional regulator